MGNVQSCVSCSFRVIKCILEPPQVSFVCGYNHRLALSVCRGMTVCVYRGMTTCVWRHDATPLPPFPNSILHSLPSPSVSHSPFLSSVISVCVCVCVCVSVCLCACVCVHTHVKRRGLVGISLTFIYMYMYVYMY